LQVDIAEHKNEDSQLNMTSKWMSKSNLS